MRAWIKLACVVLAWTIMPAGIASAGQDRPEHLAQVSTRTTNLSFTSAHPAARPASAALTSITAAPAARTAPASTTAPATSASPATTPASGHDQPGGNRTGPYLRRSAWRHPVGHRGPVWCPWRLACPVRGQPNSHRPRPRRPERGRGPARARSGHAGPVHGHGRGHAVRDRGPVRCPWRLACPVRGQPLGHRRRPRRRSRRNPADHPQPGDLARQWFSLRKPGP